jgi:hypothetical protein
VILNCINFKAFIEAIKSMPSGPHLAELMVIMEKSRMLTNAQKSVTCGPEKASADAKRTQFEPLAMAVCAPYLVSADNRLSGNWCNWVSTSLLIDETANLLPDPFIKFLPDVQQQRLVSYHQRPVNFVNSGNFEGRVIPFCVLSQARRQLPSRLGWLHLL